MSSHPRNERDSREEAEALVEVLLTKMAERGVPQHLRDGLAWYLATGQPVGGFLSAVLSNDLKETFARADEKSRARLFELVSFLYNDAPSAAWGSHERFCDWRGLLPRRTERADEAVAS